MDRPRPPRDVPPPQALHSPLPEGVAFAWRVAPAEGAPPPELSPEESALLPPGAAASRALEFALGRACARAALEQLGNGWAPVLREGPRRPRWPAGTVGSITHKGPLAAAAAAHRDAYRGLGLDVEQVCSPSAGLLRRVLSPAERATYETLAAEHPAAAGRWFTVIFSAKESLYKAVNPLTDVFFGFQAATVHLPGEPMPAGPEDERMHGRLAWRLEAPCGPGFPAGTSGVGGYSVEEGWVLTSVWLPAGA